MHTPLPDLDQMTGTPGAIVAVYSESVDVSAHVLAEATSDVWEMTPLQGKNGFGRAVGTNWMFDDWCISDYQLPPALFSLDSRHAQDAGSNILIERWVAGEERGFSNQTGTFLNRPGKISFFEQEQEFESIASARHVQSLTLPFEQLDLLSANPSNLPDIQQSSAIGRLVFTEWDDLITDLALGRGQLSNVKMARLAACVKIAIGVHPQREDVRNHARDAVFRQICRFIEENLEDPNLSTRLLLDRFGVSRATLYRMFEPLGGVRNYLTHRRAASALFFISGSEGRRGFVQAACERFGFSSPANFNRTVQRLFGNSPKALFDHQSGAQHDASSLTDFIHSFLDVAYNGISDGLPDLAV